jgi:Tfp pilus assembly protein PilV
MINIVKNKNGVTLIEVMGSVLVFTIGIAALMAVYWQAGTSSRRADNAYTAYNLAKNRLEALKSVSFSDLPSAIENSIALNKDGVADVTGSFVRSTVVTTNYSGDANLTQVTVSVSYTISGVQSLTPIQMTTVYFSNG